MSNTDPKETSPDDVLRRMLATKPKPKKLPPAQAAVAASKPAKESSTERIKPPKAVANVLYGRLKDLKPIIRCRFCVTVPTSYATDGEELTALVDTGATDVSASPALLARMGFVANGNVTTHNVGISGVRPTYLGHIVFPMTRFPENTPFHMLVQDARVIGQTFSSAYDLIIGMNVLNSLDMHFYRGGTFALMCR